MRVRTLIVVSVLTAGCSQPPAIVTDVRKGEIVRALQREFARSVDSEKAAVLASTDEESERFVTESREASAQVNQLRNELRELVTANEREAFDAFETAWARQETVDARLLPLAAANTNLKAARLSMHEAAAALDQVLAAFSTAEAATRDPLQLRQLSAAAVAALRIQALHAQHIASPDGAEMTALEARVTGFEQQVDLALAKSGSLEKTAGPPWAEYKRLTKTIFELSRQNTNVLSFSISVHEKREASKAVETALQALITRVHDVPRPSR